jgi:hypothetical protein
MAGRRKTNESITKFRFSFRKFFISKAKKLLWKKGLVQSTQNTVISVPLCILPPSPNPITLLFITYLAHPVLEAKFLSNQMSKKICRLRSTMRFIATEVDHEISRHLTEGFT